MLKEAIKKIVLNEDLSEDEAYKVVDEIMKGEAAASQLEHF